MPSNKRVMSPLQRKAELIEAKMEAGSDYVATPKEWKILKKWKEKQRQERVSVLNERKKKLQKQNTKITKEAYRRRVKSTIPRSTQDTVPYIADYEEGMFEVSPNRYSKMFKLKDINYSTAAEDEQEQLFCKLRDFYNSFSHEVYIQVVADNRFISKAEQERKILYPMAGDGLDRHREEFNRVLRRQIIAGRNDMAVEKYILVTIDADTAIEAILRFHKIQGEVIDGLKKIGSKGEKGGAEATLMSTEERLSYYHDRFRRGSEGEFKITEFKTQIINRGISSKDYIVPSLFYFDSKHFMIEDDYYRILYINNLPASLPDKFLSDLYNNDFPVTVSVGIQPVAQEKGLRMVQKQLTAIEANKIDAEKRAMRAGYNPETIQHSIKDAHAQAEALYEDLMERNQKMFFVTATCMVFGETLEELNDHCRILEGKARSYSAQLQTLTTQQEEGMKITLPFGYPPKEVKIDRALTSESTAIFMPFTSQELFQPGGFYYGLNQISRNLVVVNRTAMKTPSGFVLGSSGSGKSFAVKREIMNVLLNSPFPGILIIDPENEYTDFARAFGGTVIKISSNSDVHINPLDMTEDYGLDEDDAPDTPIEVKKDKALAKKSEYMLSIVERMISPGGINAATTLTPTQKSIMDRCLTKCYSKFLALNEYSDAEMKKQGKPPLKPFSKAHTPTLLDFQAELDKVKETSRDARELAEGVELYTKGTQNVFSYKTNVDINNRLVVFNVRDLGQNLQQIALTIMFDFIWNKMIENKNRGARTYVYCDEIHVMFKSYTSAEFLKQLYKRGRKYGLCVTGMTQNIEDLLRSEQARGMIGNSDFILMLNQAPEDLKILSDMLGISAAQETYVSGAEAGSGLLFAENTIVPFIDRFPNDSYLYTLISTKFDEGLSREEIDKQIAVIVKGS